MDFETLKVKLLKFLPQLTCYKCKKIPSADDSYHASYKCLNTNDSHLLCEKCKEKCPCGFKVCKKSYALVSNLVEMLPFCCKNRKDGCKEILSKEEMKLHHTECIFEAATCIHKECQKKMPFKEVLGHLGSDNCHRIFKVAKGAKGTTLKKTNKYSQDGFWSPTIIESNPLDEPLFYFVGVKQNGIVHFWIYYIGFKKEANRFSYSLEFGDKTHQYYNYVGPVKSIFESYDDVLKAGEVFMIATSAFLKLCNEDEDKSFECVLNIIDKKAEAQDSDDDSGVSDEQ